MLDGDTGDASELLLREVFATELEDDVVSSTELDVVPEGRLE